MNIVKQLSPNFSLGRNGKQVVAIVNHITSGSFPGCLSWLCNPQAQSSAHLLICVDGSVYQLVEFENTAWHAGIVNHPTWALYDGTNPNRRTIGIEHENLGGGQLTEPQYQSTLEIQRELVKMYNLPIDRDHIIGHYQIDSINRPNCPGAYFPWDRLINDLANPNAGMVPTVTINVVPTGTVLQGIQIDDGTGMRSYAPARALGEALGRQVDWDAATNTAIIQPISVSLIYTSYLKVAVNDKVIPGYAYKDRAYAPVRALGEALGFKVNWDEDTQTATISN